MQKLLRLKVFLGLNTISSRLVKFSNQLCIIHKKILVTCKCTSICIKGVSSVNYVEKQAKLLKTFSVHIEYDKITYIVQFYSFCTQLSFSMR